MYVCFFLHFFVKRDWILDIQSQIHYFPKEYTDDCGVQCIRSAMSFFAHTIPWSSLLYEDFKKQWILTDRWLVYNKLKQSLLLRNYTIAHFSFFPETMLANYLIKKQIPIIISLVHHNGIGHLVLITQATIQSSRIVSLTYFDPERNGHDTLSWTEFSTIYNKRGFFLEKK